MKVYSTPSPSDSVGSASDKSDSDAVMTIFVVLPSGGTITLRDCTPGCRLEHLCEKLELAAGIPSGTYSLTLPGQDDHQPQSPVHLEDKLRNGLLLKLHVMEGWLQLFLRLTERLEDEIGSDYLDLPSGSSTSATTMVHFFALFLASHQGHYKFCKRILDTGIPSFVICYKYCYHT